MLSSCKSLIWHLWSELRISPYGRWTCTAAAIMCKFSEGKILQSTKFQLICLTHNLRLSYQRALSRQAFTKGSPTGSSRSSTSTPVERFISWSVSQREGGTEITSQLVRVWLQLRLKFSRFPGAWFLWKQSTEQNLEKNNKFSWCCEVWHFRGNINSFKLVVQFGDNQGCTLLKLHVLYLFPKTGTLLISTLLWITVSHMTKQTHDRSPETQTANRRK